MREASCCSVEVLKGGAGLRVPSLRSTDATLRAAAAISATAALAAESPADLQFDYAEGLYRDGLRKLAVGELDKFVKQYPQDPRASTALFYLGECGYADQNYKVALAAYDAAVKDAALPSRPIAMFRLGFCRFKLGDAAGSIAPLEEFLKTRLLSDKQRRRDRSYGRFMKSAPASFRRERNRSFRAQCRRVLRQSMLDMPEWSDEKVLWLFPLPKKDVAWLWW